jgi:NitT/TauT family transport system substrate-binding protein
MKANVVERAMTLYDQETYAEPKAIHNPDWESGRIDFQPWPFPSATKLIVNELKNTLVGGDTKFIDGLDSDYVAKDLVDYEFVKVAMEKHQGWKKAPGFNADNPFEREEVISL